MAKQRKLDSLLTSVEAGEQEALREWSRVDTVADVRKRAVERLREQCRILFERITYLRGPARIQAVCSGNAGQARTASGYTRRLENELRQMQQAVKEREDDVRRAVERSEAARGDLTDAQVERKKVEKLLSNYAASERRVEAAREDFRLDELASRRGRKP